MNNLVHRSRTVNLIIVIIPSISDNASYPKSEKGVIMNLTGMGLQIIEWVVYLQETKEIVLIKPEYCNDLDAR